MAFLAKTDAQAAFDTVWTHRNRLLDEATRLRTSATQIVQAQFLAGIVNSIDDFKNEWAVAVQVPGVAQAAQAATGQSSQTIVADYEAVQDAANAVATWIATNLEVGPQQLAGFERSGTRYVIRQYDATEMAGILPLLDTLIAALGD